ncbi:MAG TPA: sugar ABC transporter substrate-binding protein [Vicinamibacterales bacterium]
MMKSLANEFFQTMEEGARKHQEAHAGEYRLIANGIKDELDVSRQVDLVEQMIAQRVQAIVLAPADSKALVPVAVKAHQAGIIVVNIDNRLDEELLRERGVRIPFVGPDNRRGAETVAMHLAGTLEKGAPVAILEGAPNAFNGIQRKLGFEDAIAKAGLRLVSSQTANWETSQANQVAASLLAAHPDLRAILCANDSMALGAAAAVRAAGREGKVAVVGFDNISAVRPLLADGRILATADQHADQLAVHGIEYALEILRTGVPPADRETPVDLITS